MRQLAALESLPEKFQLFFVSANIIPHNVDFTTFLKALQNPQIPVLFNVRVVSMFEKPMRKHHTQEDFMPFVASTRFLSARVQKQLKKGLGRNLTFLVIPPPSDGDEIYALTQSGGRARGSNRTSTSTARP